MDAGPDTDSEPEIDESALDSSGISDNSSAVAPDQLTTATDIDTGTDIEVATETETETQEETEVVEDVTEVAQETAADESVGAPEVDVVATTSVTENESNTTVATLSITNPGENEINFEITGEDSDKVVFDPETNSIQLIDGLDHETNDTLDITLVVTDDLGNIQINDLTIEVDDVNEAPSMLSMTHNNLISVNASINDVQANGSNISETTEIGAVVADITVADPDGDAVQYTLTGAGSDNFAISNSGEITLTSELNFESQSQFTIQVVSSDGINEIVQDVVIYVVNDNEAPSVTLDNFTVAENTATGTVLATATGLDPEGVDVTYSIAGTGSENFQIDNNGNITLIDSLDYETAQSYELTIFASDGLFSVPKVITVSITDSNEAPSVTSSVAFNSFLENTAVGTTIATSTGSDPEDDTITYSLSGTGSDKFSVDADGKVTLASALDYETATSYSINLNASDGSSTTTKVLTINVGNVAELVYSGSLAASSQNETISTGSVILSSSTSGAEGAVTYSISDPDNKFAINSSTGEVTLANALDHETKTSHSFTVTASDGSNSESQTFTLQINDIDFSLSASLASASQQETISTGSIILSSSASEAEGTVTYSLTDADNKFAINSATGEVTLASALDFETKTSHTFTVTATDGTTTKSETFTLNISDVDLGALVTSQSALATENTSSGTALYAVSSIENDGGSPTYSITAGNDAGLFAVNSSTGAISTTATALDFETAKSHTLTLTATVGSDTTSTNVVVPVYNVEELNSSVLRYSADYNSTSRTGFSATATRGPSGSSLPAYYLEQVGLTPTTVITDVDNTSNNSVPVEIAGGTALNWRYFFPIDTAGNGEFAFAPNSASVDAKYKSLLGTNVTTTISNSEFITAGRTGGEFWFMTTDKAAANISYTSKIGGSFASGDKALIIWNWPGSSYKYDGSISGSFQDLFDDRGITYDVVRHTSGTSFPTNLNDYRVIVDMRQVSGNTGTAGSDSSAIASWLQTSDRVFIGIVTDPCCSSSASYFQQYYSGILNDIGDTNISSSNIFSANNAANFPLTDEAINTYGFTSPNFSNKYKHQQSQNLIKDTSMGLSLVTSSVSNYSSALLYKRDDTNSQTLSDLLLFSDINGPNSCLKFNGTDDCASAGFVSGGEIVNSNIYGTAIDRALAYAGNATSTYNLFEDQVTIAGKVYTDATFTNFTNGSKRIISMAVIPIENFAVSGSTNDYFYPNFIPTSLWSEGDVGMDYCTGYGYVSTDCNTTYDYAYNFSRDALKTNAYIDTNRWLSSSHTNEIPEGQSLWWQVLNPSGVGVGLWAQISFQDSYDGASGSTTRDDQDSLLNVIISNVDYRKNDTTRYSTGDTGLGMDGYHYWSYQGTTNVDNDSKGINYGLSAVECATSNDSGCFWGDDTSNLPRGAMITSSDPYKSGDMTLSVNYNSDTDSFSTGTFNIATATQYVKTDSSPQVSAYLTNFRNSDFYESYASSYGGFFSGILEFDVSGAGNSQLASMRSSSTLADFTFDTINDDVQVVAPMIVSAAPSNNYTSNWTIVDTGSMTIKFGDATNDTAKSAYISSEVFGAEIQDDGAQVDGSSGGSNNLAGVMVSYNTLDKEDSDLFHTGGNDSMPNTAYSTWGFWAMSSADISPNSGTQNASVHLGSWVAGDVVDQSDIPTSGSASMSGAAVMKVASRYNQSGSNYDVHKYTTTADVAATFNWGAGSYSGQFDFTNFDDKNAIVANAGFTSFSINISGSGATYSGSLADTNNGWTREAVIAGALYGTNGSDPDESGGRLGVSLSKSGALGTAGANDFYMAEGIYLID